MDSREVQHGPSYDDVPTTSQCLTDGQSSCTHTHWSLKRSVSVSKPIADGITVKYLLLGYYTRFETLIVPTSE